MESLYLLHLGISKKLEEQTAAYFFSTEKLINVLTPRRQTRRRNILKKTVLNGCSDLLAAEKKDFPVPGMPVNISTSHGSGSLNGLFITPGLKRMPNRKDYSNVDMAFPFVSGGISGQVIKKFQQSWLYKNSHTTFRHCHSFFYNSSETKLPKICCWI